MAGGAYAALSGMRQRLDQLDRLASDLANVSTAGYKAERAATYAAERERFTAALDSAVDVAAGSRRTDFRGGAVAATGRDLDAAIDGAGFFVIDTPAGPRYTRNGSFSRGPDGRLVTADGDPVRGEDGPITLGREAARIDEDGAIRSGGAVAGRLRVVTFGSEADLVRESGGRFRAVTGAQPIPTETRVVGGSLESSNVSAVDRMVALTEITRGFEALQRGLSVLMNEVDARAISELTRRG